MYNYKLLFNYYYSFLLLILNRYKALLECLKNRLMYLYVIII